MSYPRLDEWLVSSGHYASRARARDAIKRGCVSIGSDVSVKPSRSVLDPTAVKIVDPAARWVSRAALKLKEALEKTGLSPAGKVAVDLGASAGGFCQVLLENGAEYVYAVEVGHGQMADRLKRNPKLNLIEGLNARDLQLEHLSGQNPEFLTSDLSFISLKLALPPALGMAAGGAQGVFLIKPQFEVGKEHLGRGGIVRNPDLARKTAEDMKEWLETNPGWQSIDLLPSPISGGDGNTEYLLIGQKHG
ncbi:MAG: TlyA family RNA methyltransferase [Pseudomonadota bacterium]